MADEHPSSPPRKKVKLAETATAQPKMDLREDAVGISAFVNPDLPGFTGIFKKRYTDFLVNEVLPSGEVVHLTSTSLPGRKNPEAGLQSESQGEHLLVAQLQQTEAAHESKEAASSTEPPKSEHVPEPQETEQPVQAGSTQDDPTAAESSLSAWQQFSSDTGTLTLNGEHEAQLKTLVGEKTSAELLALFNTVLATPGRRPREYGSVTCPEISDKDKRTQLHQAIRDIFRGRLESFTDDSGAINVQVSSEQRSTYGGYAGRGGAGGGRGRGGRDRGGRNGPNRSAKASFEDLGGDYLHFSLYKENKDTMECISFIARELKIKPAQFAFAGTKDRRGVTVQRVSVYRLYADRLISIGKRARGWKVGDFQYHKYALSLGDLTGNEFTITLRACTGQDKVAAAVQGLERGFINYFGMQRFGTFATRTDTIGVLLLKGDYEAATAAILKYTPQCLEAAQNPDGLVADKISQDDRNRALGIHLFEQGDIKQALWTMPRKFSAENQLIRHRSGAKEKDYFGAILTIQRNLRTMYVHAYQSLIWNMAATHRWTQYADKVMEGDLIMTSEHKKEPAADAEPVEEIDADGEVVIHAAAGDRAVTDDDRFERARPLTAEEAASGKYTVYDIVLPLPGFDVLYPSYMVKFYEETMSKDEYGNLDPHDMRRKHRDFSLSGSYRKLMARPENISFEIKEYKEENEQFVDTDADKLAKARTRARAHHDESETAGTDKAEGDTRIEEAEQPASKTAVILKFQLGSSQYATMALRELMKDGVETYKMEFSGGR